MRAWLIFAGLGGGRIPYNVNTALVPAALRSIAALSRGGFFSEYPAWAEEADRFAQVWEDETLRFFEVSHGIRKYWRHADDSGRSAFP